MNKLKYALLYLSAMAIIFIIACGVTQICFNLINSMWFSVPMTVLSLNIFGNPILNYVKHKYK